MDASRWTKAEKDRARAIASAAISARRIEEGPCIDCGAKGTQAHHEDYDQPLAVTWLCFACHQSRHGKVAVTAQSEPSDTSTPRDWMTLHSVADALGTHRATVHTYLKQGLLKGHQIRTGMWLVEPAEVERFKAEGRRPRMGRPKDAKDAQPRKRRPPRAAPAPEPPRAGE